MTFTLNILIDLCLIYVCYKLSRGKKLSRWNQDLVSTERLYMSEAKTREYINKKLILAADMLEGNRKSAIIRSHVAEKLAEKAFNMASAANLGVLALQRTLQVPRLFTKDRAKNNLIAKKRIDDLFGSQDGLLDLLRPVMTDEEIEIADKALLEKEKADLNGN